MALANLVGRLRQQPLFCGCLARIWPFLDNESRTGCCFFFKKTYALISAAQTLWQVATSQQATAPVTFEASRLWSTDVLVTLLDSPEADKVTLRHWARNPRLSVRPRCER